MSLELRIRSVVTNFNRKLTALLNESENDSALLNLLNQQRQPHIHGNDDSGIDSDDKKGPLLDIMSKVSQISQLAHEVTCSTTTNHSTKEEEEEEAALEEESGNSKYCQSPVVVIGPPGTEPHRALSRARFGSSESVVYSRSSIQLPMSYQSPSVEDIPPKDTPKVHAEVYAFVRSDEDYLYNRRMTRSGARAIQSGTAPVKPLYAESSSESETSDEDAEECRPKHHHGKKLQREHVCSHHQKTESEQRTVGMKASIEDVSVPSRELSNGTSSATPSDEVGSSDLQTSTSSPQLEEVGGLVQLSTFDVATTSEEYETAQEDSTGPVAFEAPYQGPEHQVVLSAKMSSGISTPCSGSSPISSPVTVKPSGLKTILNELQTNYSKSLKLKTSKSVKRLLPFSQRESLAKPFSVVVERLPHNVLTKKRKFGAESNVEARKVGRENSLDSDATAMSPGSFNRSASGTETDPGYDMQIPQSTTEPKSVSNLGGTPRGKKLKRDGTQPKRTASLKVPQKTFPKSLASQLKYSKHGWSSDSDFDAHTNSQLGVGRGTRRGFSSCKKSGDNEEGGTVRGKTGEGKREEFMLRGKQAKYTKSPKGKEKASSEVSLPEVINCVGCGMGIHWSDQPIHSHPRLKVLICQHCLDRFRNGDFTIEDGSEIYCTLCGDGGDLVCCGTCDKSFCQSCIRRSTGRKYLQQVLVEDWDCFMCDPSPLSKQRKLCEDLCDYYRKQPRKKRVPMKVEDGSGSENSSHSNQGNDRSSKSSFHSGSGSLNSRRTSRDDSPACDGAAREVDDRGAEEEIKQKEQQKGSSKSSVDKGEGSSRGGEGRGGDLGEDLMLSGNQDDRDWRRRSSSESDSNDQSSGDSVEVNTDDISLSDSSLFDFGWKGSKKKSKKRHHRHGGMQSAIPGTNSDPLKSGDDLDPKQDAQSSSSSSTLGARLKPDKVKKKKRKRVGCLNNSILSDSDFDGQPIPFQQKPLKKRPLSTSSASDNQGGKNNMKKSRFASALSSGSGSESERHNSRLEVSDDDDSHAPSPSMLTSPLTPDKPVKYRPRSQGGSSSDSDLGFLERKRTPKKRTRGLLSSEDRGNESSSSLESEPRKKRRKRPALGLSDDDFEDLSLRGPKLRRRVRQSVLTSDSDADADADSEGETDVQGEGKEKEGDSNAETSQEESPDKSSTPGKKRKKIRKLITDAKLTVDTKTAQRRERERMERLKEKVKLFGDANDENRLILEQDANTKEVILEVRKSLVRHIMPHQREGIKFLYDAVVENLDKTGEKGGAILAHCMGLGKSLQVIAFIDALLNARESGVSRVLILCPVNTIYNWMNEFERWICYSKCDYNVYLMTAMGVKQRHHKLRRWFDGGGVMFIGYDMFRNLAQGKHTKRKLHKEDFRKFLIDPGPDLIVCDEGHVMRNSKSNISLILNQVRTRGRIVLTGTPLQNNLLEYYTMVSFVKPNLLGTISEFKNRFVNPITNGQCQDSTPYDVRTMKMRAHILHELLVGSVQRRDYRVLAECLPPKQEYVLNIRLSPVQDQLYRRFLDKESGYHTASDLFSTFANLHKVWNHPWVLKLDEQRQAERAERLAMYGESDDDDDDDDSLGGFIVFESEEEEEEKAVKKKAKKKNKKRGSSLSSSRSSSVSNAQPHSLHSRSATPSNEVILLSSGSEDNERPSVINCDIKSVKLEGDVIMLPDSTSSDISNSNRIQTNVSGPSSMQPSQPPSHNPRRSASPLPWYHDLLREEHEFMVDLSGKLLFLIQLLTETERLKEKVLVFTQSLLTLDIIEAYLNKEEFGDWTPGLDYYRLDGSTRTDVRSSYMTEFNAKDNDRMRLFLISTRAGSLGVNLVAANRVVIFDACWNPSHDLQAIFRTYRFGQTKPIFVYRLLAQGTMEEKIYDRQVTKQSLSMRVVDEKQIGRHFTASDLAELFTYSPAPPPTERQPEKAYERPEADMVLCSILDELQPQWIINYHEHNSLLEHIFDEELSEEERKAAWERYKADMAAESARYNYQALQKGLEEQQQQQQRAQAQQLQQMIQEQRATNHSHGAGILYTLSSAVELATQVNSLQTRKNGLLRYLNNTQAQHTPLLQTEMKDIELKIKAGYARLRDAIQQVNSKAAQFQSMSETLPPSINQMVNSLRIKFSSELETLRLSQSQSLPHAGHPHSYVGSSHVPPHPNVRSVIMPYPPVQTTSSHLIPHSHT